MRKIVKTIKGRPVVEGAGVHLRRVFGFGETELFDPFLLLDDFRSDEPELYRKGFPWHPHRGIETITYMLKGTVEHGDSLKNSGVIRPGEVQWMTAGGGSYQEMPGRRGPMHGFRWANFSRRKMMKPRYLRNHRAESRGGEGGADKNLGRKYHTGPDRRRRPYLDVSVPRAACSRTPRPGHRAAYVIGGGACSAARATNFRMTRSARITDSRAGAAQNGTLAVYGDGDAVRYRRRRRRALSLISGKPIANPSPGTGPS